MEHTLLTSLFIGEIGIVNGIERSLLPTIPPTIGFTVQASGTVYVPGACWLSNNNLVPTSMARPALHKNRRHGQRRYQTQSSPTRACLCGSGHLPSKLRR